MQQVTNKPSLIQELDNRFQQHDGEAKGKLYLKVLDQEASGAFTEGDANILKALIVSSLRPYAEEVFRRVVGGRWDGIRADSTAA